MSTQASETAESQAENRQKTLDNLTKAAGVLNTAENEFKAIPLSTSATEEVLEYITLAKRRIAGRMTGTTRVLSILEAGYRKIDRPDGWVRGFLEPDPRLPKPTVPSRAWWTLGILGLILAVVAFILLDKFFVIVLWKLLGTALVVFMAPIAVFAIHTAETPQAIKERTEDRLKTVGLPTTANFFFLGVLPNEAQTAIARAKASEVFDAIQIIGPRARFETEQVGPYIVVGTRGSNDIFLIYQLDPQAREATAAPPS